MKTIEIETELISRTIDSIKSILEHVGEGVSPETDSCFCYVQSNLFDLQAAALASAKEYFGFSDSHPIKDEEEEINP